MNRHYIIRESQFHLTRQKELRCIGVSPKAVKTTIVLDTGGPITVDLQKDGPDEHMEINTLHTMYDFDTQHPSIVHHISLQAQLDGDTHGTIIIWGMAPQKHQNA
ncbi:MAG: hypothetical protein WC124_11635 [Desulfoplanes sp.]